jgi:hypothetical protein
LPHHHLVRVGVNTSILILIVSILLYFLQASLIAYAIWHKYSIAITADDSVTKKFPVLEDGPLEVALFWLTQFDELAQHKNFDAANKFTNVLLLLSGDAKDKWINASNDIMPNNENPTEACFCTVWTAFIINYGASNKTAKGLQDFL